MSDSVRCHARFSFAGMVTVFECTNEKDHAGRWHGYEDTEAGVPFTVEWMDLDEDD